MHLPCIVLNFNQPHDYPSVSPPNFTLTCPWLSDFEVSWLVWFNNAGTSCYMHIALDASVIRLCTIKLKSGKEFIISTWLLSMVLRAMYISLEHWIIFFSDETRTSPEILTAFIQIFVFYMTQFIKHKWVVQVPVESCIKKLCCCSSFSFSTCAVEMFLTSNPSLSYGIPFVVKTCEERLSKCCIAIVLSLFKPTETHRT